MPDDKPTPLPYESKHKPANRVRPVMLTETQREVLNFVKWILWFGVIGIVLGILFHH